MLQASLSTLTIFIGLYCIKTVLLDKEVEGENVTEEGSILHHSQDRNSFKESSLTQGNLWGNESKGMTWMKKRQEAVLQRE